MSRPFMSLLSAISAQPNLLYLALAEMNKGKTDILYCPFHLTALTYELELFVHRYWFTFFPKRDFLCQQDQRVVHVEQLQ